MNYKKYILKEINEESYIDDIFFDYEYDSYDYFEDIINAEKVEKNENDENDEKLNKELEEFLAF